MGCEKLLLRSLRTRHAANAAVTAPNLNVGKFPGIWGNQAGPNYRVSVGLCLDIVTAVNSVLFVEDVATIVCHVPPPRRGFILFSQRPFVSQEATSLGGLALVTLKLQWRAYLEWPFGGVLSALIHLPY